MSKYINNLVSLYEGLRTPSEKTHDMIGPRLSTHKTIAQALYREVILHFTLDIFKQQNVKRSM